MLKTLTGKTAGLTVNCTLFNRTSNALIRTPISQAPLFGCHPRHNPLNTVYLVRTLFTSPVTYFETRKRRKTYPFFWLQDKYRMYYDEKLTPENEQFFQNWLKNKYSLPKGTSPLKREPWNTQEEYTETTQRTGVIARKLGRANIWDNQGKRVVCTVLQVTDNHVVRYHSPEEFALIGRPLDVKKNPGLGVLIVGSDSRDPRQFTAEYNGLFNESGIMPTKHLTRFFITHNARMEPGTPLLASHFRPGMFVDVYGKSTFWGNKGLRFTHPGLKLGQAGHGCTKQHNRIGSIGRGRKYAGPKKGKRMPASKGNERVITPGLKVLRVNTKYNLLYVMGTNIPGRPGTYVNLMDSRLFKKKPCDLDVQVAFPTISQEENDKLDLELWAANLHKPSDPSIVMEVTEEERKAAEMAARKIGKAKTAQKFR